MYNIYILFYMLYDINRYNIQIQKIYELNILYFILYLINI